MDRTLKAVMQALLMEIRGRVSAGETREYGICIWFWSEAEDRMPPGDLGAAGVELRRLMRQWPEFSGNPDYPVPGVNGGTPESAYVEASIHELWSPLYTYGAARRRLLDWLIEQLQTETTAHIGPQT